MSSRSGECQPGHWTLWESYRNTFIDTQGRVIDPQGNDYTTSEGQAYAMFFALAANDQTHFEKLLHWTQDNLAGGDLSTQLPGWKWGKDAHNQWHILDSHSAADADLWMSYVLFEAGRLWSNPAYTNLGNRMAALIAAEEVKDIPGLGMVLLPGNKGFHPDDATWYLNPSYQPLQLLVRLEHLDPHGPWRDVAESMPKLIQLGTRRGFVMDWVKYNQHDGFEPSSHPGEKGSNAIGSYDAIRVYLWAGMANPHMPEQRAILQAITGMSTYLERNPLPPEKVSDEGVPGTAVSPVGFSAALLPYLQATGNGKGAQIQLRRIAIEQNSTTKLLGAQHTYYDQNLALFGLGWMDCRFRFGKDGELKVLWKRG